MLVISIRPSTQIAIIGGRRWLKPRENPVGSSATCTRKRFHIDIQIGMSPRWSITMFMIGSLRSQTFQSALVLC